MAASDRARNHPRLKFCHRPLDTGCQEIRLIRLSPVTFLHTASKVICTIEHFDLHTVGHKYRALSYTWGSQSPRREIEINGRTLIIYPNLYDILIAYRRKIKTPQYLWIDQLCIDQENASKKNHQVGLMGSIYSKALEVIIWLGPADRRTESVAKFVRWHESNTRLIMRVGGDEQRKIRLRAPIRSTGVDLWIGSAPIIRTLYHSIKFSIADLAGAKIPETTLIRFLELPFWSRLWICQEVLLAPKRVMLCGATWISWEQWCLCVSRLKPLRREGYLRQIEYLTKHTSDNGLLNVILAGTTLREAVESLLDSECQDPCDKIYAILGIVRYGQNMTIDYSRPIEEVFEDAMRMIGTEYWIEPNLRQSRDWVLYDAIAFVKIGVRLGLSMLPHLYKDFQSARPQTRRVTSVNRALDTALNSDTKQWEPLLTITENAGWASWLVTMTMSYLGLREEPLFFERKSFSRIK